MRALLEPTFLAGCPIVPVSVKTGQGLGELRSALAELARAVPATIHGPDAAPADRPRLHDPGIRHRRDGHARRGALRGGGQDRGLPAGSRVAGARAPGAWPRRRGRLRRPAHRASICRGWSGRPSSAVTCVAPAGALLPALLADATLELLADAPRAAQGARPRALPRGHAGGDGPGPPRRPRGARAGPRVLRALPPGGADRRAARRPLRDPLLFPHRHDRGRHAARHRAAALQAKGTGPARAPAAPRPGHGGPGPGGAPPPGGRGGARAADLRARTPFGPDELRRASRGGGEGGHRARGGPRVVSAPGRQ